MNRMLNLFATWLALILIPIGFFIIFAIGLIGACIPKPKEKEQTE